MDQTEDFQKRVERIESLTRAMEATRDPEARALARELIQAVTDLHGAGFERMIEIVHDRGADDLMEALTEDPLAGRLMILHGLHPLDLQARVARAIERVGPVFRKQHAEVELLAVECAVAQLRISFSQPASRGVGRSLRKAIEEEIFALAPDVTRIDGMDALGESDLVTIENPANKAVTA